MITFVRNIQFTKLIKIEGRLKEFNFRKPNSRMESLFTVDTAEEYGSRIIFQMQRVDNDWLIITPDLPVWIQQKEKEFSEVIKTELDQ